MFISKPNEDGVVFITGERHKYIVVYKIEGELCDPVIKTAKEIFETMDLRDCYNIEISDLKLFKYVNGVYPNCEFYPTWCCYDPETGKLDRLRMEIRNSESNEILDVGYGTDH